MELGSACNKPPRLSKASTAVHPTRGRNPALHREQLRHARQCGVKALIACGRRLITQQGSFSRPGGAPEVVSEPEQQPKRVLLTTLPKVLLNRLCQLG